MKNSCGIFPIGGKKHHHHPCLKQIQFDLNMVHCCVCFFWLFCCTILILCFVHSDFGSRAWLQTASCVPPMKVHHALSVCPCQQTYGFSRLYQHNWRDVLLCEQQDKVIVRLCCWNAVFLNKLFQRMSSSPAAQSRGNLVVGVLGKIIGPFDVWHQMSIESQMQVKA